MSQKKERVIVYVDGFNLYFGLIQAGFVNCKWLDLNKLAHNLLQSNQEIIEIKYFTSRVSNNPDKQKRQSTYIEALESPRAHSPLLAAESASIKNNLRGSKIPRCLLRGSSICWH